VLAIFIGGIIAAKNTNRDAPQVAPTSASAPPVGQTAPATNNQTDPALVAAVYAFTEAYNLPASDHRNELLKKLCTSDGYEMVFRDAKSVSLAEKAAGDITLKVVPGDNSTVQVEPFGYDYNVVSVSSTLTVQIVKDDAVLQTITLPRLTTSWIKQSDGWRLAYLQL
jgi:hypothetical protein